MDAPTAPYVAFVESDAGNDDWITGDAGDPDAIDWSKFTEGTDAIVFEKIFRRTNTAIPGNTAEPRSGGNTFEIRTGKRRYAFNYQFILNSRAAVNLATKFPMLERHTEVTKPFVKYYLVDLQAANDHITFVDNGGAVKSYCRCHIQSLAEVWTAALSNKHLIQVSGVSTW